MVFHSLTWLKTLQCLLMFNWTLGYHSSLSTFVEDYERYAKRKKWVCKIMPIKSEIPQDNQRVGNRAGKNPSLILADSSAS